LAPVVLLVIWIGMYPQPFLKRMEASTRALVERVVTVAYLRAAQGGTTRCPAVGQSGPEVAISNRQRSRLIPLTCRESRHAVPEAEG
jgi:hypothetical protein